MPVSRKDATTPQRKKHHMNSASFRNQHPQHSRKNILVHLFPVFLALAAFFDAFIAIGLLFNPSYAWLALGQNPVPLVMLRWSGGVMLAVSLGNYLALRQPAGQARWVFLIGLAHLFGGLGLSYSLIAGETVGPAPWGTELVCGFLIVALLLFASLPGVTMARRL